jgi:hypothetical protein
MLANETKSKREEIWNRVTDAAKKYSDENGRVKFSNEAICIVGRKYATMEIMIIFLFLLLIYSDITECPNYSPVRGNGLFTYGFN